ncbi:MAG: hypothetical protein H7144_01860 [Burkholderiales bacterium]|nr:hypothetical protein [Phycisphaerae bacterium]
MDSFDWSNGTENFYIGNESTEASISGLTSGKSYTATFTVMLVGTWDGDTTTHGWGPDSFSFGANGGAISSGTFGSGVYTFSHTFAAQSGGETFIFESQLSMASDPDEVARLMVDPYNLDEGWRIADAVVRETVPSVSIAKRASDGDASESPDANGDPDTATFRVTRTGDTTDALTVNLHPLAGTAEIGASKDYTTDLTDASSVTIPADEEYVDIVITAKKDDKIEGDETIVLCLKADEDYRLGGYSAEAVIKRGTHVVTITPNPIGADGIGEANEGQSKATGDADKLGFWLRRTGTESDLESSLTVQLQYGGNAEIGSDVWGLPQSVEFTEDEDEVFVPIGMTEDATPEWTELFQVKIKESDEYTAQAGEPDYASFKILDDDYFYVGSYEAPDTEAEVTVSETSGGTVVNSHDEQIPLEVVGTEFNAVFGLADENWLPWATGAETSGGDAATKLFDGAVDVLPTSDATFNPSSGASAPGNVPGDPMQHARNLAILEEYKPEYSFEVSPGGEHYIGKDVQGRSIRFNMNLTQTSYKGTHKGWYLKPNPDGSLERWGGEFVDKPHLIERVRSTKEELKQQINLAKDKHFQDYNEQTEEHRIMREQFSDFCTALQALLETGVSLAPGATAIDIQEAVTGQDAFRPSAQISGGSRAMSAASAGLPIIGVIKRASKLANAAEQLRENWKAGREFQGVVTQALGEVENKHKLAAVLRSGKVYRTIPDIISVSKNSIIEIKRVNGLSSLTPQLEGQILAAKELGMKYRLILGPDATADGVALVVRNFMTDNLPDKSSIVKFNPQTRKLEHLWP